MRPVNYFKNRIEFALKGNGTIKVNNQKKQFSKWKENNLLKSNFQ
jgi:hypothetical protein